MTEQEALTKWCPMARVTARGESTQTSWNRFNDGDAPLPKNGAHCIGSGCMAWRHFPPETWGVQEPPYHPDNKPILPEDGFCGLAGKP